MQENVRNLYLDMQNMGDILRMQRGLMPKPNSPQLREQIVDAITGGMSIAEAVETFQIARRTVYYYLQRARLVAGADESVAVRGPKSKLENYKLQILRAQQSSPDLTMKELCELLKLPVSPSTLSRMLQRWRNPQSQTGTRDSQ